MKKKCFWSLLTLMMVAMVSLSLSSCGNDNDEDGGGLGSGLKGWYTNLNDVAKQSDFNVINEAIDNEEVLSSYRYGGQIHKHIASYDEFIGSDGVYSDSNASFGRLRFTISNHINAIRIVDDTTLLFYSAWLYIDGRGSGDVVYKLHAGRIFGNMAYYGTPSYYTYAKVDNKLIVSNGDIYTVVDGGLIKDGSSAKWSKYDPAKRN
ncbi:MAG: hypothetical protein Q4F47_08055 [Bacteroidaceae bacterium]|nr:hypothetical protein [Bacteroidaceae bacterium]